MKSFGVFPAGWRVFAPLFLLLLNLCLPYQAIGETLVLRSGENGYSGVKAVQATSQVIRYSGEGVPIFIGQMGPGNHGFARVFFSFDLAPLYAKIGSGSLKVNAVSFSLYKTRGPAVDTALDLRLLGDGGSLYPVGDRGDPVENWTAAPTEPGGTLGAHLAQAPNPLGTEQEILFESTADFVKAVEEALKRGDSVFRFVVLWDGDTEGSAPRGERMSRFLGVDAEVPTGRPTLTVDYTVSP